MDDDINPINAIPPVIVALTLIVVVVELVVSLGATGFVGGPSAIRWRLIGLQDYAFSPLVMDHILTRGDYSLALLKRFVTYPFIQGSFTNALFAAALLLALGKFVGDVFRPFAVIVVFFGAAFAGAVAFGLIAGGSAPLFGAFTPIYGLIGAYTYIIWLQLGATGQNQLQAFRLIGFLLALQLVFGLLFGSDLTWIAELTGFFTGFALSVIVAPGGWSAMLARLRQRG